MEEESDHLAFPAEPPTADGPWQATDIVLDCFLVTDDRHRGAFGSSGDRQKALLVLKQVPVLDDGSLEGITDFQVSTVAKDDAPIIFEASGKTFLPRCPGQGQPSSQSYLPTPGSHLPGVHPTSLLCATLLPSGLGTDSPGRGLAAC